MRYLFAILLLLSPVIALGDTQILRPYGDDAVEWSNQGDCSEGDNYECVSEEVADDGDSYVVDLFNDKEDRYTLDDWSLPGGNIVDSVVVTTRGKRSTTGTFGWVAYVWYDSDSTISDAHTAASYTTFTDNLACPGGGDWDDVTFDDLKVGIIGDDLSIGKSTLVTQVFVTVYYSGTGEAIDITNDTTIQDLAPTNLDSIIVNDGAKLTINSNWNAGATDTTCLLIYVKQGGTLEWNTSGGSRVNVCELFVGGKGSDAPFDTDNGGTLNMGADDTLGLWKTGNYFDAAGSAAAININGSAASSRSVIMSMDKDNRAIVYCDDNNVDWDFDYAKFYRLGTGVYENIGVVMLGTNYTEDNLSFDNCVFDSCGLIFRGRGVKINTCSLYTYQGHCYSIIIDDNGSNTAEDTIWNCYIENDNNNSESSGPDYLIRIESDSCVVRGTTIRSTNTNGVDGMSVRGIGYFGGGAPLYGCKALYDTCDASQFNLYVGINPGDGLIDFLIDSCVFMNAGHEEILTQEYASLIDSAITIQRSVFYGGPDGGILIDRNDDRYMDLKIMHNTFCDVDVTNGGYGIVIRNKGASDIDISGVYIANNIVIRKNNDFDDIRIHNSSTGNIDVICVDMKNNAYSDLNVTGSNTLTITGGAYTIADSNLNSQTEFGFTDSAAFDFTLGVGSPMINAADSAYGCLTYEGSVDCNEDPYDIGAFQYDAPSEGLPQSIHGIDGPGVRHSIDGGSVLHGP